MNYCAEIHSIKKIFDFVGKFAQTLHKKRSLPLRSFSVNVTKSAVS